MVSERSQQKGNLKYDGYIQGDSAWLPGKHLSPVANQVAFVNRLIRYF
ncbi:hypothetical protein F652_4080 [Enterobacteriaceae bacterium bta3-1]|nr:hypothetical protein F652_4080 [Enterobacteriaceae bacterium bta3-1]